MAGCACLLIASQPDLGTALVIGFTLTALLVAAGMPIRHLAIAAGDPRRPDLPLRARRALPPGAPDVVPGPWANAGTSGFQSVQGQIALGSGGLLGRGLGHSVQKIFYLPEAHTDFILAIIGEELGVVGVSAVLFLYGLIAYAGLRVAKVARGSYAKLLATGVTSLILCQGCLNVFTVLGLAPLTGVPLPFLSYGSTNLIVLLGAMGLLLNVANGGVAHLKVVPRPQGSTHGKRPDRGRGNGGARRARAGGRRRAAG